jgi:hypothetical protein
MLAAFSGAVELAQAAAKRFDFLFVPDLLPLGQFESFEHCLHVIQRGSERLDDMIDLLDGLLDGHGSPGLRLAHGRRGQISRLANFLPGHLAFLARRRWGDLAGFARGCWGSLPQLAW